MYNYIDVAVVKVMLMFVTFMCIVFHNQSVLKKRKERNLNLMTKNRVHSNSDSPDYFYIQH